MGLWMLGQYITPDWVVSSTAMRAKQTALEVCHALGIEKGLIHWEPTVYEASLKDLLAVLKRCPGDKQHILLVGHNPGLEDLLCFLTHGVSPLPDVAKLLPTGGLACLELLVPVDSLKIGSARLERLIGPKTLPGDVSG
jgi:phosphohistidine phosphatase